MSALTTTGAHVLLTGASSGIGEALAREFSRAGARLSLVARRKDKLEALAQELGGSVACIGADLSDLDCIARVLAEAQAAHGEVDVLVNNAGVQLVGPFHELPIEDTERMYRLNLLAPLRFTRTLLPGMVARKAGIIVDVASVAAFAAMPYATDYSGSKAGLGVLSECLRGELRGTGVHVVTVFPGPVSTPMEQVARDNFGAESKVAAAVPTGNAPTLARKIVRAVEKRQARVIYPASYGVSRWFPGTTRFLMDRATPKPKGTSRSS